MPPAPGGFPGSAYDAIGNWTGPGDPGPAPQPRPQPVALGTPGLPQEPAPGQGPQQPAWLKEVKGIETFDADEREFVERQAQGGMRHAEIVRALDERRRGGAGAARGQGGSGPAVPGRPPARPTPRDGVIGGKPTGTPEVPGPRDKRDKQESISIQNEFGEAMASAGYRVEWQAPPREEDGTDTDKRPEMRLGDHLANVTAPMSDNVGQVRRLVSRKVQERQAFRIMVDLVRTQVTREQLAALLARKPIEGLQELFVREQDGTIHRVLSDPELIAAPPRVFLPSAAPR